MWIRSFRSVTFSLAVAVAAPFLQAAPAVTHDALVTALEAKFPIGKGAAGTVFFTIQKEGLLCFSGFIVPGNKIVDGRVERSRMASMNSAAVPMGVGTRVFVSKIESKNEVVNVHVSTADKYDVNMGGLPGQAKLKAVLAFHFAKDYLDTAAVGPVAQQIAMFLAPESAAPAGAPPTAGAPGNAPPPPPVTPPPPPQKESFDPVAPPPPPPDAAPVPTQSIGLGQTPEQVTGIMGKPSKIVDAGPRKKLYQYPGLTVVFTNGKVSDVQ